MSEKLVECTIQMLLEDTNTVTGYRSVSAEELITLLQNKPVEGRFDNSSEKQTTGSASNVVAFFTNPIKWEDKSHMFLIQCKFNKNDIVETGTGKYYASDTLSKTGIWTGRTGTYSYSLDEFYVNSYSIRNVTAWVNTSKYNIETILGNWAKYNGDYTVIYDNFKKLNLPQYNLSDIKTNIPYTQDEDTPVYVWRVWYGFNNKPGGISKERYKQKNIKELLSDGFKLFKTKKEAEEFYQQELQKYNNSKSN